MNHLTFAITLRLKRTPSCPLCGARLHPTAVSFRRGIAWCEPCSNFPVEHLTTQLHALRHPLLATERQHTNGLTWYVPTTESIVSADTRLTQLLTEQP
jgi:recombinational DNA repair protein (RecF pathway)